MWFKMVICWAKIQIISRKDAIISGKMPNFAEIFKNYRK